MAPLAHPVEAKMGESPTENILQISTHADLLYAIKYRQYSSEAIMDAESCTMLLVPESFARLHDTAFPGPLSSVDVV